MFQRSELLVDSDSYQSRYAMNHSDSAQRSILATQLLQQAHPHHSFKDTSTQLSSSSKLSFPTSSLNATNQRRPLDSIHSATIEQIYTSRLLGQRQLIGGGVGKGLNKHHQQPQEQQARSIPSGPERVLDAPGLVDDFYLNVLDWSVRNIIAVGLGESVYLWNATDGSVRELLTLPESEESLVTSLSWIHDGKSLAIGTSNGLTQIWDIERSKKLRTMIASPDARVASLSWNRHLLSTGSRDGSVLTHDVRIARHLSIIHQRPNPTITNNGGGSDEICGLAWSPDGQQLAAGGNDNLVRIWSSTFSNFATPSATLAGHCSAVKALAWCPWRTGILATGGGSADKTIKLWNTTASTIESDNELIDSLDTGSQISSLCWSTRQQELFAAHGFDRNHLSIWSADESARHLKHAADIEHAHDSRILHMAMSPDEKTIATAAADESIKFWSIFTRKNNSSKSSKSSSLPMAGHDFLSRDGNGDNHYSPFSLRTKNFC